MGVGETSENEERRKKRTFLEIRDEICNALRMRPMGLHELCRKCNLNIQTAKRQVWYLEGVGVVGKTNFSVKKLKRGKVEEAWVARYTLIQRY